MRPDLVPCAAMSHATCFALGTTRAVTMSVRRPLLTDALGFVRLSGGPSEPRRVRSRSTWTRGLDNVIVGMHAQASAAKSASSRPLGRKLLRVGMAHSVVYGSGWRHAVARGWHDGRSAIPGWRDDTGASRPRSHRDEAGAPAALSAWLKTLSRPKRA